MIQWFEMIMKFFSVSGSHGGDNSLDYLFILVFDFVPTGLPRNCRAHSSNNFSAHQSNLLCVWTNW